jgi:uncharacterized delta-60 repeat protein
VVAATSLLALAGAGLAAPGDLDSTFGGDGRLTIDYGGTDVAEDVLVQPDGTIVTAGYGGVGTFRISRFNPNGALDPGFGNQPVDFSGSFDQATTIARQPDGRLIVAGASSGVAVQNVAVARLETNGLLDDSFPGGGADGDGRLELDLGGADAAQDVQLQPDGKIVLVGTGNATQDVAVVRLRQDGSFDSTFAGDGVVNVNLGGADVGNAAALQVDGKIVVAAASTGPGSNVVIRLGPSGARDTTFGDDGVQVVRFAGGGSQARGLALQPDGRLVSAGGNVFGDVAVARVQGDPPSGGPGPAVGPGAAGAGARTRCGGKAATIVGTPARTSCAAPSGRT